MGRLAAHRLTMATPYTIRRIADGAVVCSGRTNAPLASITPPEGHEVLPYRVPGDVGRITAQGAQEKRPPRPVLTT